MNLQDRMMSSLRSVPFRGVFWDTNVKKWSMEKHSKNESEIFMQALRDLMGHPACGPLKQFRNIPEWGMGHTTCPRNTPLVPRRHGGGYFDLAKDVYHDIDYCIAYCVWLKHSSVKHPSVAPTFARVTFMCLAFVVSEISYIRYYHGVSRCTVF